TEEEALAPAEQLKQRFLLLGTIVLVSGLLAAWVVTQRIVKPIRQLTVSSARLAMGDFSVPMPLERHDEIGQLSAAFRTMTQQLARSRDELVRRNEALSALNSVAVAISQSLKLEDVLATAIAKVLDVTGGKGGCVFLTDPDRKECKITSSTGPLSAFNCRDSLYSNSTCACNQALQSGRTMVVIQADQCSVLSDARAAGEDIGGFVSVPLKSKERVMGIMNIAYSDQEHITPTELAILDAVGYHMGLAIDNAILYEEAREKEELRGQLLGKVISAQEEERKRIARELHDEFGQTLTGLIMNIESVEAAISTRQAQLKQRMASARACAVQALDELRKLTLGLRPSVLDDLGLVAAVRSYAQSYLDARSIHLQFEAGGIGGRLDPSVETALFRIVQEAIHNTTRHAGARRVHIRLEAGSGRITTVVEDDGSGFDVDDVLRPGSRPQSLGLLGIRERVTLLGGTFDIKSQPGRGTRLTVEVPFDSSLQ
ncbi:MAG: histidine kinase, partial [Bacteroidetes bacterium]|nr:histidine kinase [Bacteroidota bacterium]